MTDHTLRTMEEENPVVVGGVEREGDHLKRLIFHPLMECACSQQLDIGVENCSFGVLQLRDAGWHSGGTRGIAGTPNLRIVGS